MSNIFVAHCKLERSKILSITYIGCKLKLDTKSNNNMKRQLTLFNTFAQPEKIYKVAENNYEKFINKYYANHIEDGSRKYVKEKGDKL